MVIRVNTDPQLRDPKVVTMLFSDTRMSVVWLVARVWLGWTWLNGGRDKMTAEGWMGGGLALKAHWERVVAGSGGIAMTSGWYRDVVRFMLDNEWYGWCGKLFAVSEVVVGLALILGVFTGIAALLGSLLTFTFLIASVTSANPLVFALSFGVMAAWKVAGYIGLDAFVLPRFGAPWPPGVHWSRIRPGARHFPAQNDAGAGAGQFSHSRDIGG
jgi:thiosulfate dehydrogenase (quinone) large subunit